MSKVLEKRESIVSQTSSSFSALLDMLADSRFSQYVCFLTWAPVSQVRTLKAICHIYREKSGTTPGGMKTISFQQVKSAPKTSLVVYKT